MPKRTDISVMPDATRCSTKLWGAATNQAKPHLHRPPKGFRLRHPTPALAVQSRGTRQHAYVHQRCITGRVSRGHTRRWTEQRGSLHDEEPIPSDRIKRSLGTLQIRESAAGSNIRTSQSRQTHGVTLPPLVRTHEGGGGGVSNRNDTNQKCRPRPQGNP